jgi:hypothetical protein
MPAVPDETERAYEAPVSSQNFSSKALQRGPVVIQSDLKQEETASISFSPMEGLLKGKNSFLISIRNRFTFLSKISNKLNIKQSLNSN